VTLSRIRSIEVTILATEHHDEAKERAMNATTTCRETNAWYKRWMTMLGGVRGRALGAIVGSLLLMTLVPLAGAQAPLPSFRLQYLGNGSPSGINNNGIVIGTRTVSSRYEPLVSVGGAPWTVLPAPSGGVSTFPTDVNDSGVIVGVSFNANFNAVAVRWKPQVAGGYAVEVLPRLQGDKSSYATSINNLGEIVGARRTLGYVPAATTGWLYSDTLGVVDLSTFGFWIVPTAINDAGQIIGGVERLDLETGLVDVVGNGPANYNLVSGVALNQAGMIAGVASLRSSSLNVLSVFRHEGAAGWRYIAGTSRYTTATSINNLGDIGYGEQGAGLYLEGLGLFAVNSLLRADVVAAGWAVTGSGAYINDGRLVATVGRNSTTGAVGGVLLIPAGVLAPPTAPANLQGVAHPATSAEPYNAINLTWSNTSAATTGYDLERQQAGTTVWSRLSLVPPGTAASHVDSTVGVGIVYDYRVRAIGAGGASEWSNVARVQSPSAPLDTIAPSVNLRAPASGASVSGIVTVTADATDNVAVTALDISYWNPTLGQEVLLGSVKGAALSVSWDTRSLAPGPYRLRATAYDAAGNWKQADVTVTVSAAIPAIVKVSDISLSGRIRSGSVTITGDVSVQDGSGRAAANASVTARWTGPGGTLQAVTLSTDSQGRARFDTTGPRGTYTLSIIGVAKAGFAFDAAHSIMAKSITR